MNENFEAPGASAGAMTDLDLLRAAVARRVLGEEAGR